jgi:hypothetical protein
MNTNLVYFLSAFETMLAAGIYLHTSPGLVPINENTLKNYMISYQI